MNDRISICNIPVDVLTMQSTLDKIEMALTERRFLQHVVVNAAKIVYAQKDTVLKQSIITCDIINADGQSVVWASKLLNKPLPERVTGIDLMQNLVAMAADKKRKIYFLGAKEEVVKKVVEKYSKLYGEHIIGGYHHGFFKKEEEQKIAERIAASGSDILFVAISSPKKEIFLNKYRDILSTPFIMGVGGSFDVVAELVQRAPLWIQKMGFEWLFRLWQEPGRMWKRYLLTNTLFIYLIWKEKILQILKNKNLTRSSLN